MKVTKDNVCPYCGGSLPGAKKGDEIDFCIVKGQ